MVLAIYAKMIVRIIVIAVLLITLAGLAARFALYMWGDVKLLEPLRTRCYLGIILQADLSMRTRAFMSSM